MNAHETLRQLSSGDCNVVYMKGLAFGRRPFSASIMRPLVRRGLFERVEMKGFQVHWRLTPLGTAVRNLIINPMGGDQLDPDSP